MWNRVSHSQLLQSQAWRVRSYTFSFRLSQQISNRGTWKCIHLCESRVLCGQCQQTGWDWALPTGSLGTSGSQRGHSWAQQPLKSHADSSVYRVNSVGTSHQKKKKPHGQYYIIRTNILIGDFPMEETLHHAWGSKNKPGTCICSKHKKSLDELLVIFFWLIISHAEHCDVGFKFIP